MNKVAWSRRWSDRNASIDFAAKARDAASKGTGRRSRVQNGLALGTLAWHAAWRGNLDEAMGHCLSAETFLSERENAEARAKVYAILGKVHLAHNRFDLSDCSLERGFWLLRDMPEADVNEALVELLLTRAYVQRNTGERARSGITLGRAQEICNESMAPVVGFWTAKWLLFDGDAEAARQHSVTTFEAANEQSNRIILPHLYGVIGACDARLGRREEAVASLEKGMALAEEGGDHLIICLIHSFYAQIEKQRGDLQAAKSHLEAAMRIAKELGHAFERKRIALQLADLLEELKEYKKAVQQHKLAWRLQNETRVN
ncbi:MAG: tetratricopeptide repeat protein [Silicimonas sp.]|nr:tetratricopeptide repeat protein [Silicimonas sp.]